MNVGLLDKRCAIEYPLVTGQDPEYGTDIVVWALLAVVWMNVEDVMPSRAEAVRMGLAVARNQVRCRYRYHPSLASVTSAMRITIRGPVDRVLQIIAGPAAIAERNAYSEVMCEIIS